MTSVNKQIILIFLCLLILFSMVFSINTRISGYSISGKGIQHLFNDYKLYLGNILWMKIDEFFHISMTMNEKDMINISTLAFRLNPHNAYFTSITILHMANIDYRTDYAEKLGQEFIKENPKHPQLHKVLGALGWLHLKKHEYEDAESALLTALKVANKTGAAMTNDLGEFLFPLNYITMLQYIYKEEGKKDSLDKMSNMKETLQKSGYRFNELDIAAQVNKEEKEENHHHHHDSMLFMWQRLTGKELEEK